MLTDSRTERETTTRPRGGWPTAIALSLILVGLAGTSLLVPEPQSLIGDEHYYYHNGQGILSGNPSAIGEHDVNLRNIMPLGALYPLTSRLIRDGFGAPRLAGFSPSANAIFYAKSCTIVLFLGLALLVYVFARELYGAAAGVLAMTLTVFDPNLLAHSRVVHQDMMGAFFITAAVYCFWRFLSRPAWPTGAWSIATFAAAQIARFTSLFLAPVFLLLVVGRFGPGLIRSLRRFGLTAVVGPLRRFAGWGIAYVLVSLTVINLGYSSDRTGTRLADLDLHSQALAGVQAHAGPFRTLPIPLPLSYVRGLDLVRLKQETGFGSGPSYLLGKIGETDGKRHGFVTYFLVAFLFKVPLASQILLVAAVVDLLRRRGWHGFWRDEAFLLVPSSVYFVVFSLSTCQLGLRYILMVFPLLWVFAGRVVQRWTERSKGFRLAVVALVAYLVVSNLSYFPHYIPYFNELLTDRRMAYTILADSNLNWGQSGFYLTRYIEEHPEAMLAPSWRVLRRHPEVRLPWDPLWDPTRPIPGIVIIGASDLVGVTDDPERYRWLRETLSPRDHVAYSYLVFEIRPEDIPKSLTRPHDP
jgi:hypothetical protein